MYGPLRLAILTLFLACGEPAPATEIPCEPAPALCDGLETSISSQRDMPPGVPISDGTGMLAVGDLAGTGLQQVYLGSGAEITRLDGEGWATSTAVWQGQTKAYPLVADLTGDGVLDLVIDMPDSVDDGEVLIYAGPVTGLVDRDTPHVTLSGRGPRWADFYPHQTYVSAADLNGDGFVDLVAGAWVKFGPLTADAIFDPAVDALWQETSRTKVYAQAAGPDVTGDGVADLIFSAGILTPYACAPPEFWWSDVRIARGPLTAGSTSIESAPIRLGVTDTGGVPILPWFADVDGDGRHDMLTVGYSPTTGLPEAKLYAAPIADGALPDFTFAIPPAVPDGILDLDGDDVLDLLLGGVAVLSGPLTALPPSDPATCSVVIDELWAETWDGTDAAWGAGIYTDASWTGDLDHDGVDDLVVAQNEELFILLGGQ